MFDLLRRREFTIGLIAPFTLRRTRGQEIVAGKLPFGQDITRGDVTLRLFRSYTGGLGDLHLEVAISCQDPRMNVAIVTAFYNRKVRLPYESDGNGLELGKEVDVVRSEARVGTAVNPSVPLLLDPFEKYPADSLAFIRVEMAQSLASQEFKPEA